MKKTHKILSVASAIALVTGLSGQSHADVGVADIVGDQASTQDIVSYGLGPRGRH